MQVNLGTFGDVVAFVLPGLALLVAFAESSDSIRTWFGRSAEQPPTFGGVLLLIAFALGLGIMLDAVRLLTIDPIHHATGITPATWSYAQLDESRFSQFEGIVESHFRFHQFYGNLVVAVAIGGLIRVARLGRACWPPGKVAVLMSVVAIVGWLGSRTELRASYDAIAELLGPR